MNDLDLAALRPFVRALARLDEYGAPPDDCPLFVDWNNCSYELLNGEEGERLTMRHLRQLAAVVEAA